MDKIKQELLNEFLTALDKSDCNETRDIIKTSFGLFETSPNTVFFEDECESCYVHDPIEYNLIEGHAIKVIESSKLHQLMQNSEIDFQKYKKSVSAYDKIMRKFVSHTNDENIEYLYKDILHIYDQDTKRLFDDYRTIGIQISQHLKIIKGKRGASIFTLCLNSFYEFIFHLAYLYDDLSDNDYKVNKSVGSGPYVAMTKGMDFVWTGFKWLQNYGISQGIELKFTDKNLMTACDKARTRLIKIKLRKNN